MACHRVFFIILILAEILSSRAFATITFVSAGGYSNAVTTVTEVAPTPVASASPGVGGQVAFPTFYFSNITTNLYSGANPPAYPLYVDGGGSNCSKALNQNCKNTSDTFSVTVASNAPVTGGANYFYWVYPGTTTTFTGSISSFPNIAPPQPYVPGEAISFTTTWGNLCSIIATENAAADISSTCGDTATPPGPHSVTLYLIADTESTGQVGSEVASFTVTFISSIPEYSITADNVGFYGFLTFPGDQKAYIQGPIGGGSQTDADFPQQSAEGAAVQTLLVYYTSVPLINGDYNTQDNYNAANFANLSPLVAPANFSIGINALDGTLNPNNEVTGLSDGQMYYFRVGMVDMAGNIGYLTEPTTEDSVNHTAIPDEVIGLLASDHCFIATAAWGSPLAKQVKLLREFRDKILLPSARGKKFVQWYYQHSPPWAYWLIQHKDAKPLIRAGLYPLVAYSFVALKIGATNAALLFATLLLLPLLILRWTTTSRLRRENS